MDLNNFLDNMGGATKNPGEVDFTKTSEMLYKMRQSLVEAGFTPTEAMQITMQLLINAMNK